MSARLGWVPGRLRAYREWFALTRSEVVNRLRAEAASRGEPESGVDERQIWRWETGSAFPRVYNRRLLCAIFGASEAELGFRPPLPDEVVRQPPWAGPGRGHGTPAERRPREVAAVSHRRGDDAAGTGVTGGTAEGGRRENEEADTDRRALLRLGGLTVAAATAAEISRLIAIADADPLAVDSFEAGIQRIATTYTVTAHPDLAPQVEAGWLATERMLDTRIPAAVRTRVTRLAGQYSFYLGLLAFDLGDDAAAQRFLTLSARHAEEVGDLLTTGSVAAIRSSVAFFTGRYDEAADLAAAARPHSHPYTRPILAGCEARGAARAGRPEAATLAVADMTAHVWDGEVLPGPNKGGEQFAHGFRARVFADLGDGERAEPHARASLALLEGTGHYVQLGGSRNSLGRALLRRERPEPEQAAAAVADAVRALGGRPNRGVLDAGEELWQAMNARWPHLPAVRDLGEMLKLARRALPGSRSAADL